MNALLLDLFVEMSQPSAMNQKYKVGDKVFGKNVYKFANYFSPYVYEMLEVKDESRFGEPNQLLTVKISTKTGFIVNLKTERWADQLF